MQVHKKTVKQKMLKRMVLSAVVAGTVLLPAFAAPGVLAADTTTTFTEFVGDTQKGGTITVTENTNVTSENAGASGYLEPQEVVGNYTINLANDATLTLNDLNMYNTNIVGIDGEYGGDININITKPYSTGGAYGGGLVAGSATNSGTVIKANNLTINNTTTGDSWRSSGIFVGSGENGDMDIDLTGKLSVTANYHGITTEAGTHSVIDIDANEVMIDAKGWGVFINGTSSVDMVAAQDIDIHGAQGISNNSTEALNFESKEGNVEIHADTLYGIAAGTGDVNVKGHINQIAVDENSSYTGYVIRSTNGHVKVESVTGDNILTGGAKTTGIYSLTNADAGVDLISAQDNTVTAALNGAYSRAGTITLDAARDNVVTSGTEALKADGAQSIVQALADRTNRITAGETIDVTYGDNTITFGTDAASYAINGGHTIAESDVENILAGSVYASGEGSRADVAGKDGHVINNYVYSAAVIDGAGDLPVAEEGNEFYGKSVISALYAEDGAQITVNGAQNVIRTYADNTNPDQLERTVWAYNGAEIDIDGTTLISTDRYETSPNSLDIAIAAGSATGLTEEAVNAPVTNPSVVNLTYGSYTDADGNFVSSSITGDILAAYTGQVNIAPKDADAKINITGNLLAGNNGELNVNLGNGGILTGRADDYGDAGVIDNSGHGTEFFDPAFSSDIYKGGVINLTMGENSRWNVTGQSWITTVDTTGSSNALIDLVSANTDRNATAHALTIYDMKGNATFNMNLNGDRTVSDMLYMKNADGEYLVNVYEAVTLDDMYAAREGGTFDGLRFATVGAGSNATFRAITYGQGVNNIEYEVGTDQYADNEENIHYNSSDGSGSGDTEKPGSAMADGFFTSTGTPGVQENSIMTMAATEGMGTDTGANGTTVDETTNYKLIGVKSTELSNAGKTVVSMSKVNYSNAIYMDRLNKRMGEARYIDGDEGLWVRIRHDRIGKSDAFRSKNTMMELGYDRRVDDREDGEHRQGFAIDYMRGTTSYDNVAGDGDVRRGGIWLYDTWLGDKGHYTDYVLKIGRLSNDFEVYSELGEKITGDYSNFVYSASAEYGRKKDLGNDWYIEPQAQLQYAHVTDADYTTSQGTDVDLDAIDSLIGRIGFRLGRDMGENNTFYIKADILHEFLGDQDIEARDATGFLSTTYENEGTWYDVGLGFSHQFSKGTYMFLDVEKSFGNDNEDTYQFNVGMNWKV